MTWVRHRPKTLAWTLLAAVVLVVGQGVWRYARGGVAVEEDLFGLVFRVAVVALLVGVYLRSGGVTTASTEGLVVHDGIRRLEFPAATVRKVDRDPARGGAVAVLSDGRRVELPGVAGDQARDVWRELRRR
jgi:hypothetical protein